VLWRRTADRVLLLPATEGELVSLTGTGVVLWDLLAEPTDADELCRTLASVYGADPRIVATDIAPVLEDLTARRLILSEGTP
jgi:hypothetical protein